MSSSPHAKTITHIDRAADREIERKPLDLKLLKRLFAFTRPYARQRNALMVFVLLLAALTTGMSWAISAVLKGPVKSGNFEGTVLGAAGFLAIAVLCHLVIHFRQRYAMMLGENVVHDLRNQIFEHLQRMSMHYYDRTKLGRIISRMTSDTEAVRAGVQEVLFVTLVGGGRMLIAAGIMCYYDLPLFGVVLAMAPVLWVINNYFRVRLSNAFRDVQESFSRVTATLAESVTGIRVTQGFVRQDVNATLFRDLVEDHSEYNMRTARLAGVFLPLLELNSQFFIGLLLLLGGYQVLHGGFFAGPSPDETFGSLVVFFFMVPHFFQPIMALGQQYNQAMTAMAGGERVFALLDTPPDQLDPPDPTHLPMIQGKVEFRDVSFGYDPAKHVIHELNFTTKPGQTVALVGHTGCGKSTIIKLICKFYLPTEGELLIDGHDIRQISSESLLSQIGIVLQQNFLFTGTVMDNIRVGKTHASDEQVVEAARKLDCLDLLEALPEGLYTEVGEKGSNLSLGQRQLVCFTRAMLADPRILILDEATSSVDTMTEARIQKALGVLLQGRTSFVVAHRLSTIRHADQVLVLDHGRIIERGTHNQLLATGGVYANLYRQFIHASEA